MVHAIATETAMTARVSAVVKDCWTNAKSAAAWESNQAIVIALVVFWTVHFHVVAAP